MSDPKQHRNSGPIVDLGDGITATAAEILERCIEAGGIDAYDDVLDQIVLERGGRLDDARPRVRTRPPRPDLTGAIAIGPPVPIANSAGLSHAVWVGRGIVGYKKHDMLVDRSLGGHVVVAWEEPGGHARRLTELRGLTASNLSPSPSGDDVALHIMRGSRSGHGWSNACASCVLIAVATGETRSVLDSTHDFELWFSPVWSADGARIAIDGVDPRGAPPMSTVVRVLDVATGRSIASMARRASMRAIRFDGDDVILRIDDAFYRWRLGAMTLEHAPPEPGWRTYVLPSGEPAEVWDEDADGRVLLQHADALAWSVRART